MLPSVRFAPSPTGYIHLGNARPALFNALFARKSGGTYTLRFDDTDAARSRREYADQTEADLAWLGIPPDRVIRQSERLDLYGEAAERLKAAGRLYPCYETPEELERRRRLALARGAPPIYDRAALALTETDRARLEAEGRTPHWRFRLDGRVVAWTDGVRGPTSVDAGSLSDPVLVRADGSYLYTLPSCVDDVSLAITHVIRGEDHVTNTAVQIQVIEALGGTVPVFAHHNLLITPEGEGLSKRSGALGIRELAADGFEPIAVATMAVLTGSSDDVRPVASIDALASIFDLSHVSRSPARFDPAELETLNGRVLHAMPFEEAAPRLAALGIGGGAEFWDAVRPNLARLNDALRWWAIVEGPVVPVVDESDRAFLDAALAALPAGPWDGGTWKSWTGAVRGATGRSGRALFMPLRLALTGLDRGPELAGLLPLIGPERARDRLAGSVI